MLTLITGGTRSGKSTFAQSLCERGASVVYIATASASDDEMRERIARHRSSRPICWRTVAEPLAVPDVVRTHASGSDFILIDCLTLWLSNLLFEWRDSDAATVERRACEQARELTEASTQGRVIAVTNEVGSGIVPESSVARQFRDIQGLINQQIARAADAVYLLTCGIPIQIKPNARGGL
jgi:adenosylcobinamide kinase / adenosylcobinamide-phosphate guanylyltransferase